jgi:hypothetical protein
MKSTCELCGVYTYTKKQFTNHIIKTTCAECRFHHYIDERLDRASKNKKKSAALTKFIKLRRLKKEGLQSSTNLNLEAPYRT